MARLNPAIDDYTLVDLLNRIAVLEQRTAVTDGGATLLPDLGAVWWIEPDPDVPGTYIVTGPGVEADAADGVLNVPVSTLIVPNTAIPGAYRLPLITE
jgi:hypothetical protein